ncbi:MULTISPECIES: hypothetical protein [unclassified Streptomyces]|uniref:hypothetical protein n=1 Tax=unclassified Streptomyces TaxID=2593676 RepID=UPI0019CF8EE9|nr:MULTISPECIES: hypothetical protein [unclassified Streptomyces]
MTAPRPRPPGKGTTPTPDRPHPADPPAPSAAVGEPTGAARKGVRTALRPDPQTGDGRHPIAWLHIVAPRGAAPTATSRCACGRDRSAVGRARVLALIASHAAHRETCPLRNPQEGRHAA